MSSDKKKLMPPKWPLKFFRWFCNPDYVEDIEGDLAERFEKRVEAGEMAYILFIKDVLLLFRPGIIRPIEGAYKLNQFSIIKHSLKISLRMIFRERTYSLLNIVGMGFSIVAALFIFLYVNGERSYDTFHNDHENLYRITSTYSRSDGQERTLATSPPSLTALLREKIPEVEEAIQLHKYSWDLTVAHKNIKFRENKVLFVEPGFLNQFNFPLLKGNPETCLSKIQGVVITKKNTRKYFGDDDPIGKLITLDGTSDIYEITGIVQDPPINSHIQFDFLMSYEIIDAWWDGEAKSSWDIEWFHSYIRLNPGTDLEMLTNKLNSLFLEERGIFNEEKGVHQHFELQSMASIHLGPTIENELEPNQHGDGLTVTVLYAVGWFIIVIAWINYINLSTAKSIKRAVEVGIRKAIGAKKRQLIFQFIAEALLINLMAITFGLTMLVCSLNYFNLFTSSLLTIDFLNELSFWKWLLIYWISASLISGIYPAYKLASHKAVSVVSYVNNMKQSGSHMRRLLVIFQFACSVTLISGTMIIYKQLIYMKNTDLGFDKANVMIIKGPNHTSEDSDSLINGKYNTFMNEMERNASIISVTSSATVPGELLYDAVGVRTIESEIEDAQSVNYTWVSYDYFTTFNIPILCGRSFHPSFNDSQSVLINEKTANLLGFDLVEKAIGQKLILGRSSNRTIIGVVKDFKQESFHRKVSPMVIELSGAPVNYYVVKFSGNYGPITETVEELYESIYPRDPFDFFFLDEFYNRQYNQEDRLSKVILLFTIVAIFIACLGLFGLASYNVLQRTKEIGIRKVLGARLNALIYLLSKEYALLIFMACSVAFPLVYVVMSEWLNNFAGRVVIGFSVFFVSGVIVMLLSFLTIGSIMVKMASSNPIHSLRNE